MFQAVSYALLDSINVLLIGVIVAIGVVLPPGGKYRRIIALLVGGDWLGVFLSSVPVLLLFDSIGEPIRHAIESPWFGVVLILVGALSAVLTWRGGGDSSQIVAKVMRWLREPSANTLLTGMVLGAVQSLTSVPFYIGLGFLSVGGFSVAIRYTALVLYASLALSLPFLAAIAVGMVRRRPRSLAGRGFAWAREHSQQMSAGAGYFVAVVLILIGLGHL
ncbi:hypothetical protein [Corynebacterium pelargi]|uniref:Uncharacterized protein n=1 Tax=Corynebacterium pelargi TaxID=1471400 RepID=A0A410W9W1_9CORY|nr:hypothetical protein [Corynebacterium pelargi]QAU52740.1 hypothetical protein CPELA_07400 [Corynebacterium pelargi]GGG78483.1 hypothetical protein GCM10007338_15690 [Corynebacterium pelargi]